MKNYILPLSLFFLPLGESMAQSLPNVGDCYGGGIVYYIGPKNNQPVGKRGLIASVEDVGIYSVAKPGSTVPPLSAIQLFTGYKNTQDLLKLNPNTVMNFPAAYYASNYKPIINSDQPCLDCTSWYLPSMHELKLLYIQTNLNLTAKVNFENCKGTKPSGGAYWSSSLLEERKMWYVSFDQGNSNAGKVDAQEITKPLRVRAVRAF